MTATSDALPPAVSRAVIVGAGQAGLAVARALMERGLRPQEDFHIVDAGGPATLAWKRRWHSLTLFTPAWYSSLRGLKLPGDPGRYPRGDEIADYLDRYRDEMGLIPSWNVTARSVGPDPHGHGLVLTTNMGQTWTRNVVAATGPFGAPQFPALAAPSVLLVLPCTATSTPIRSRFRAAVCWSSGRGARAFSSRAS